jgi:hypothetical protein
MTAKDSPKSVHASSNNAGSGQVALLRRGEGLAARRERQDLESYHRERDVKRGKLGSGRVKMLGLQLQLNLSYGTTKSRWAEEGGLKFRVGERC